MGMYNLVHGENSGAVVLLGILGLQRDAVPRYRDCWWTGTEIAIHTRTGGGNREYYESESVCRNNYPEYFDGKEGPSGPWNEDLQALPTFLRDEDDDFDSTYATFYFSVPDSLAWMIPALTTQEESPGERWEKIIAKLRDPASAEDPQIRRCMAVLGPMLDQITKIAKR